MWENVTVVLCLLGFVGAMAMVFVELPAVVTQSRQAFRRHT